MSDGCNSALTWLPPYTHVPGATPHPISDPSGHSHGSVDSSDTWTVAEHFFRGRYLFDHGFYWEAHEAWEQLWIRFGRKGTEADVVKGLIKLSACGVKCLEGNESGAVRHGTRAAELLQLDFESSWLNVEDFEVFRRLSRRAAESPPVLDCPSNGEVNIIF